MKDVEKVSVYMQQLNHPLKAEIEVLRTIIKETDASISERIKWNAPSYYCKEDFLTFNHRMQDKVHLIFHNDSIPKVSSTILEGDYKDRRMVYFKDMTDVLSKKTELQRVITELLVLINN
ncbi:hypothetical protein EMA8858_01626 [Emticicia aquatica]|jgi:uncharacterized protein YdhG (YjbR/CyaY superfamily)|uniref:YdhG-like domain-containing protein n=1 Tax=Emticicia aquatica TaxID=1681835 RepID=A0ABN8ERH8_9BACT|nr:DUF1801 domain-containing protein [Emticicia aquatica]CAH0995503.1 hypothetical protein EMA8858_01626 [Emticicia aquatica]